MEERSAWRSRTCRDWDGGEKVSLAAPAGRILERGGPRLTARGAAGALLVGPEGVVSLGGRSGGSVRRSIVSGGGGWSNAARLADLPRRRSGRGLVSKIGPVGGGGPSRGRIRRRPPRSYARGEQLGPPRVPRPVATGPTSCAPPSDPHGGPKSGALVSPRFGPSSEPREILDALRERYDTSFL